MHLPGVELDPKVRGNILRISSPRLIMGHIQKLHIFMYCPFNIHSI
jgi:hypothetical protein